MSFRIEEKLNIDNNNLFFFKKWLNMNKAKKLYNGRIVTSIYFDNQIVGRTTSGNFSFCYNKNIAFGYVETKKLEELGEKKIYIEVEKVKYIATIILKPLNTKKIRNM